MAGTTFGPEPMRRAVLRTAGRRGFRVGLAGAALSAVAAADAAVGSRRPGLRLLAAGGGLLAATALAGWQIYHFHGGDQTDQVRPGPPADPLADATADGELANETAAEETAPDRVPLPPVAKSLLLGAGVSAGLHVIALAESALSRGIAAGIRRAVPGAGPVAGVAGHTAAFGATLAGLRFAVEYLTRGDCATVALQYSLRPSFLSLDRVAMGREQNRALLHALEWRLRGLPEGRRPCLVGFGESLGAHTMQDAFLHEGVSGLHRVGMDRACSSAPQPKANGPGSGAWTRRRPIPMLSG